MTMFTLAKSYRFSAAHTLRSPWLNDDENCRMYGKCANASGHGHDYMVEIRLSGNRLSNDVLIGRGLLDRIVYDLVSPRLDRKDVNITLGPDFISSGENLAIAVHGLVRPHIPAQFDLEVKLVETEKNSFVYSGE